VYLHNDITCELLFLNKLSLYCLSLDHIILHLDRYDDKWERCS